MNEIQRADVGFAQVKNEVLFSNTISLKAKGLFAYIYAKPHDWQFSAKRIAEEIKEGRNSVLSAMKELEDNGYLKRQRLSNGRVKYYLSYEVEPSTQNSTVGQEPQSQNATVVKRHRGIVKPISNKESYRQTKKEHANTIATTSVAEEDAPKVSKDVNEILEAFQMRLNPTISYGNKTQRSAVEYMLKQLGKEKVLKAIEYCAQIQADQFAPIITTPYQLKEKWAQLSIYYNKSSVKATEKQGITI